VTVDVQSEITTGHQPIIRPVSLSEAADLSPWPDRIAGRSPWVKSTRSREDHDREYDQGVYADLLERWEAFVSGVALARRHPGIVLRFFDDIRRGSHEAMLANRGVYGEVDLANYLVSVGDRLFAADISLFEQLYRYFIVERVVEAHAQEPFGVIVEIGCGSGVNLFHLYLHLALTSIAGVDLSPNAISFLRQVAGDLGIDGSFQVGDFRDENALRRIVPDAQSWALLSAHAVERVEMLGVGWFEKIVALENPPSVAIHFEPVLWADNLPFARQCTRYAELNRYNRDFLESLHAAEAAGLLTVVHAQRRVLGNSAFAPTSLLVWTPRG
jgi:SAM-dependent methyltransferase